ncbi:MbcA/ParS/Xre antitoxin family protein [Dyella acidisoli]|uniref:Antitoxin Xre/MbcA/ParS-like toxin-binding domain-containing protein n=1 Tax=Dyella acidisoli TaxID=1867834 RepID=A0ABQ5XK54_9GAMM|nr:MbcA/ParS/Xre antitoxin family protein [Dyella acidisoli]GLQ91998.1 hypothetical protein GCM10007901_09490 [Dyella acidisoli]
MASVDDLNVQRVLRAAEAISGDRARAIAWLQQPILDFNGKKPMDLVDEGRTDALLRYLNSIEVGPVG